MVETTVIIQLEWENPDQVAEAGKQIVIKVQLPSNLMGNTKAIEFEQVIELP